MFKNMRLVIVFDMLLNPSFKMTTSFANVARTAASTSKFIWEQDNFLPDNCPPDKIISPWTTGAQTIASQNNLLLICTPK